MEPARWRGMRQECKGKCGNWNILGTGNSVYEAPEVRRMRYLVLPESTYFLQPVPVLFLINSSRLSLVATRQIEISFLCYTSSSELYILFYSFIFCINSCIGGLSILLHRVFILLLSRTTRFSSVWAVP